MIALTWWKKTKRNIPYIQSTAFFHKTPFFLFFSEAAGGQLAFFFLPQYNIVSSTWLGQLGLRTLRPHWSNRLSLSVSVRLAYMSGWLIFLVFGCFVVLFCFSLKTETGMWFFFLEKNVSNKCSDELNLHRKKETSDKKQTNRCLNIQSSRRGLVVYLLDFQLWG